MVTGMSNTRIQQEAKVVVGSRPVGSCKPDGSHLWAIRTFEDGVYKFTTFNGWLISSETSTDNLALANIIQGSLREVLS